MRICCKEGLEIKTVVGTSLCMFNTYKIKIKFHQQITYHKYKFSAVLSQSTVKRNALSGGGLGGGEYMRAICMSEQCVSV